ncbi:hypothetical protein ABZ924_34090 [Streptomyces sp. NPDC046876]|uniref:hypothetical protein n=1 Tax=Streptomyces sp. NPDC046876 TaxID=3155616 RepID=UPI00340A3342
MRIQRILAITAALTCLAVLPACKGGGGQAAPPGTPASSASLAADGAAGDGPLVKAQQYMREWAGCENLSSKADDPRIPSGDFPKVGQWSVTEIGVCSTTADKSDIVIAVPKDMKEFQAGYKQYVMDKIAGGDGAYGLFSNVIIGKGFVAFPTLPKTSMALVRSEMRVLTCNPTAPVPKGYKREQALVEYCNLSDFVPAKDGTGSPNLETPQEGPNGRPGQPTTGSLGLPRAGSIAELRTLVSNSPLACKDHFSTDPEAVAIESIDFQPVVKGNAADWGVTGRALCGQPADGQRARNLSWLDTVGDMKKLQTKAKAAQLADLKDDGKLRATGSVLLVGENVAVETNDASARFVLYQHPRFLYLNCVPGFSAPTGYRLEKAQVEGCVLTNYEPEHPVG